MVLLFHRYWYLSPKKVLYTTLQSIDTPKVCISATPNRCHQEYRYLRIDTFSGIDTFRYMSIDTSIKSVDTCIFATCKDTRIDISIQVSILLILVSILFLVKVSIFVSESIDNCIHTCNPYEEPRQTISWFLAKVSK